MAIKKSKVMDLGDGQLLYNDLRNRIENIDVAEDIIVVQDETPTNPDTVIWLPETQPDSVQVATYAELTAVEEAKADTSIIAHDYADLTFPVSAGTLCMHQGSLYKANQAISTQEEFDSDHWDETNVADENSALKNEITNTKDSIAPEEASATATAAHAVGDLFWYNGTLHVATSAIAVGDTIVDTGTGANCKDTTISEALIKDIQIDGSSILASGVANIPVMTSSRLGVAKVQNTFGLDIYNGILYIITANTANIKQGTVNYKPIVPLHQHESAFYGIATAAGNSDQASSNNSVGTYTEDALSKISDMFNAPVTVSGTTPSITAKSGIRYICGECATLSIAAPASGIIDVTFVSGSTPTVLTVSSAKSGVTAIKWVGDFDPTSLDANATYEVNIMDGEWGMAVSWT